MSAAGGREREQKGAAAVEILRSEQRAINFGHRKGQKRKKRLRWSVFADEAKGEALREER